MKLAKLTITALCAAATPALAQPAYHNQYPCAECAVYDNNGHDLMSFINTNKRETETRGSKVNEYSGNTWGYMEVHTGNVPSVVSKGERKGELSHAESIRSTFALYQAPGGTKATWWARESNNTTAPLVYMRVDDKGKLSLENIHYNKVMSELNTKTFTIVEFEDTNYNQRDYDNLLKNYMLIERGIVKDPNNYETIIKFFNGFLDKFTYVSDPLLEKKSFITIFSAGDTRYIGYFNIVNGKLAGHVEVLDLQFEADKDAVVNRIMKQLTGIRVYVYGNDVYGLEKSFSTYARLHNVKIRPWKTNNPGKFNTDK